eukprot:gnl/TRDRNA2_/TRDRNA2_168557_c1_seq1.p1 gnl/TRDRNA2_/TRDRNA2_168557_c1~~gnl/TRDRNA2_/TRDRNA2_168557_c1_seq1.p1  ORF type:complete len:156 (+),score=14.78 gnl/TRDRNA2_/TRDRNA2_168557_c1_seq1:2-469(+)
MVEPPCRAKLLDFGLSRVLTKHAGSLGGALNWAAPELLIDKVAPHPAADVFSFGRLVYFISTGEIPLRNHTHADIVNAAKEGKSLALVWPRDDYLALYGHALASTCLCLAPETRASMKDMQRGLEGWRIPDNQNFNFTKIPLSTPEVTPIGRSLL